MPLTSTYPPFSMGRREGSTRRRFLHDAHLPRSPRPVPPDRAALLQPAGATVADTGGASGTLCNAPGECASPVPHGRCTRFRAPAGNSRVPVHTDVHETGRPCLPHRLLHVGQREIGGSRDARGYGCRDGIGQNPAMGDSGRVWCFGSGVFCPSFSPTGWPQRDFFHLSGSIEIRRVPGEMSPEQDRVCARDSSIGRPQDERHK
jgi:hypothetical protein